MKKKVRNIGILAISLFLALFIVVLDCQDSMAQARVKKRKSNNTSKNRRMGSYRGGNINFKKEFRYFSAGFNINSTNYLGDITPSSSIISTDFSSTRLGAGVSLTYRLLSNISVGTSLTWNRLYGNDFDSADPSDELSGNYRYVRNLHFRNDIYEFAAIGTVDLFHNRGSYFVRPQWIPYAFTGVSIFYHNPMAIAPQFDLSGAPLPEAGKWVPLRPLGTEGQLSEGYDVKKYSAIQAAIPIGAGVRYKLNTYLDFEFELGYRYLFTDYIDDVSRDYTDLGALDGELAKAMAFRSLEPTSATSGQPRRPIESDHQVVSRFDGRVYDVLKGYGHDGIKNMRGNPGDNDHYFVTSLKIKYILHAPNRRSSFR